MTKYRALEVAYRCEGLSQVADAYSEEAYRDAAVELRRLYAHRETLLGALKAVEPILTRMYGAQAADLPPMQMVRAAIALAEGTGD